MDFSNSEPSETIITGVQQVTQLFQIRRAVRKLHESIKVLSENSISEEDLNRINAAGDSEVGKIITNDNAIRYFSNNKNLMELKKLDTQIKCNLQLPLSLALSCSPPIINGQLKLNFAGLGEATSTPEKQHLYFDRLTALGEVWLTSILTNVLFKQFPLIDSKSLTSKVNEILKNKNTRFWINGVNSLKFFELGTTTNYPLVFKQYIGSLIIDNNGSPPPDVTEWIESLYEDPQAPTYKTNKALLEEKLLPNPLCLELKYSKISDTPPLIIKLDFGKEELSLGSGDTFIDAEENAALNAIQKLYLLQSKGFQGNTKRLKPTEGKITFKKRSLDDMEKDSMTDQERNIALYTASNNFDKARKLMKMAKETPEGSDRPGKSNNTALGETDNGDGLTNANHPINESSSKLETNGESKQGTLDKSFKEELYALLGKRYYKPHYRTRKTKSGLFHSICYVKGKKNTD
ncbi:uncharacterized protein NDAI_0K02960 [Naumovozyma dairenensis CBS 421]|uniref:RNase III domain-containing protein n=1 Tax=Naumovozyma dairenensis (strain ATCC 10597 / BCRC 20456 / CBS 421 / NBRC 0211 / NRRL Y-12639) TaxID=1071378 RepID=G0WI76_NAUDC|nr:hypothetical protein NDAI_0K02960 [Naumovozyma dairenensis CBS 421]CCD27487.1 hypothetical protein NDAI_0K02960 [Naumovozyma dairenensis CBS 421]